MKDINLKRFDDLDDSEDENDFVVTRLDDEIAPAGKIAEPSGKVRVSFAKFAHLVARGDIDEIIMNNKEAEVILDTDLLTELATPSEEIEEKKIPVIFSVGLAVGILLTYLLFKYF